MGFRYDALDLLRSDHMRVEKLALQLRFSRDAKRRKELLGLIGSLLDRHMAIEEEIFYPACARLDRLAGVIDHARTDHQLIRNALKDLAVMDPMSGGFDGLVTTAIKEVEHHALEEEGRIFGAVRMYMSWAELREVSRRMHEENESRKSQAAKAA